MNQTSTTINSSDDGFLVPKKEVIDGNILKLQRELQENEKVRRHCEVKPPNGPLYAWRPEDPNKGLRKRRDPPERPHERKDFAGALFNEDLKDLITWHKERPVNDQKRFLRTLDTLYGVARHCKMNGHDTWRQQENIATDRGEADAETQKKPLQRAVSTPALRPIDMFLQKKKEERLRKSVKRGNIEDWLDQQSVSTESTKQSSLGSSEWSKWSQTTADSDSSHPIKTANKTHYRHHKRGAALNKNRWRATDPHASTDNVPSFGYSDDLRFRTTLQSFFGEIKKGSKPVDERMYASLYREGEHPFIEEYLKQSSPRTRAEFCEITRCLENFRFNKNYKTSHKRDFNLKEQGKLWFPQKVIPEKNCTSTQVPLGTIDEMLDFHRENHGLPRQGAPPKKPGDPDVLILQSARSDPSFPPPTPVEPRPRHLPPLTGIPQLNLADVEIPQYQFEQ